MFGILIKIVDNFSYLLLGIKKDDNISDFIDEKNVKYTITSVYPSKSTMLEAQKYL